MTSDDFMCVTKDLLIIQIYMYGLNIWEFVSAHSLYKRQNIMTMSERLCKAESPSQYDCALL